MNNERVVGGVRTALSPEQQLEALLQFRGQRAEIEEQLLRGSLTIADVQALVEHRPAAGKSKPVSFTFLKSALFKGSTEPFNTERARVLEVRRPSGSIGRDPLILFAGYKEPPSPPASLAVCEFFGISTDSQIIAALGRWIRITFAQLEWAVTASDLLENDRSYICYVATPDGYDRALCLRERRIVSCKPPSDKEGWSDTRVLCQNLFEPGS